MNSLLIVFLSLFIGHGKVVKITSPALEKNGSIPSKYTCDGENINPPLVISAYPEKTKSLVLIMEDPDAPNQSFYHWVAWNIMPGDSIAENSAPGVQGKNSSNDIGYVGPCPPEGEHRYIFRVYALDEMLGLTEGATRQEVEEAMKNHIVSKGELTGRYKKK